MRCNFFSKFRKILYMGFRATLIFQCCHCLKMSSCSLKEINFHGELIHDSLSWLVIYETTVLLYDFSSQPSVLHLVQLAQHITNSCPFVEFTSVWKLYCLMFHTNSCNIVTISQPSAPPSTASLAHHLAHTSIKYTQFFLMCY